MKLWVSLAGLAALVLWILLGLFFDKDMCMLNPAILWQRGQPARQPAPKYDMRLFGSAGSWPAVGHTQNLHVYIKPSGKSAMRLPYLMGIAFPSTGPPDPIRGYAIPGCARRDTHKVLIDQ